MMRFTLTGDLSALTRFGNKVASLGKPSTLTALSKELADEALFQVQRGFVEQRDPYGRPWHPKKYPDGRRILRGKTGQLERSFRRVYAGADGAIISSRAPHAIFTLGTGRYGKSGQPIKPKRAKALRWRGPGGKWVFAKQVEGSRQRLLLPLPGQPSPIWQKALTERARAFIMKRLGKVARGA